jgi:hypothetical protein
VNAGCGAGRRGRARDGTVAGLLAALLGTAGCAYALVEGGVVRPEPFERIVERTVLARGIAPSREVRSRVIAAAELPELLRGALAEEWSGAEIDAYEQGLTTLGLWPADRDLADEFIAVYAEEVVGLYLPTQRTLFLVRDAPNPLALRLLSVLTRRDLQREVILSHELVHFLQHEAFPGWIEPDPFWRTQDDLAAALQAALEGDALYYGFASLEIDPPGAEQLRAAMERESESRAGGALAEAPALLRYTVAFPYAYGYGLSLREGQRLLAAPPASTEQVLHPERRSEPFQAIDLAAVRGALPAGCRFRYENTLGELGISVLLRDLGSEVDAAAWGGWDGDRWLAADCDGRPELLWLTAWDSEADAGEFTAAYAGIAPAVAARASLGAPAAPRRVGREVWIATAAFSEDVARLAALARRARVGDVAGVRAHFGAPAAATRSTAAPPARAPRRAGDGPAPSGGTRR